MGHNLETVTVQAAIYEEVESIGEVLDGQAATLRTLGKGIEMERKIVGDLTERAGEVDVQAEKVHEGVLAFTAKVGGAGAGTDEEHGHGRAGGLDE